jgi:hypothetical protein
MRMVEGIASLVCFVVVVAVPCIVFADIILWLPHQVNEF